MNDRVQAANIIMRIALIILLLAALVYEYMSNR
jgi:hypothetical protein